MNWQTWKLGLIVASLTGLLTGLAAFELLDKVNGQSLAKLLCFTIGVTAKDALLYMKSHPPLFLDERRRNKRPSIQSEPPVI